MLLLLLLSLQQPAQLLQILLQQQLPSLALQLCVCKHTYNYNNTFSLLLLEIRCPTPENGTNTEPIPEKLSDGLGYLESYTYECSEGYASTRDLCTICQPDGTLSLPPPTCNG